MHYDVDNTRPILFEIGNNVAVTFMTIIILCCFWRCGA